MTFGDADSDYAPASVLSRRIESSSSRLSQMESAVMTNRGAAQQRADIWLDDLWAARETAAFDLDPNLLAIEPGDIVTLAHAGAVRTLRIGEIVEGRTRRITARMSDVAVYDRIAPDVVAPPVHPPPVFGPPHVLLLDLALARFDPVALQYMAATADPWPGALHVFRTVSGASNEYVATLPRRATIGVTLDDLPPGLPARFDRGAHLRIRLTSGALASVTDVQALGGANTFALQGVDGAWEIFCAANADLVDADTYRLSRLVRGLGGTEALARRTVAAGAPFVLLDAAVVPVASGLSSLGSTTSLRIGPATRDPADPSYVTVTSVVPKTALMPFAPVQASAARAADGIMLAWVRRSRVDFDSWDPLDIPLGEEGERYEVAIARPGRDARLIGTDMPNALYARDDIVADFGATPMTLDLTIVQISATVGPGVPLVTTVPVG